MPSRPDDLNREMRADRFRFRPPEYELPAELIWVLTRAYGPPGAATARIARPESVLGWAGALGLRERIGGRLAVVARDPELPEKIAGELERAREALAARTLLLQKLLDRVAERAHEIGTTVIALKGIALLEAGISDWGDRPLLDVDLLVPPEDARELAGSLERTGMERSGPGERHHLPPLADRRLGEVELHLHLPGLLVAGRRSATARDLREAGLAVASERLAGLELPVPVLLRAHALSHALDQHGLSPTAYPVTRLVSDLIDLREVEGGDAAEWLRGSVSAREQQAADRLSAALAAGEIGEAGDDGSALLRHTVVAICSRPYRRRLRLRSALRAIRRGRWSKFRSELYRRVGAGRKLE